MPFAESEDKMREGKTMTDEQTTPAQTLEQTLARIVNRHMARTLEGLTEAGCAAVFVIAVKSNMRWLRSDVCKAARESEGTDGSADA